ncbi:hypothetical protein D6D17_00650 [Aureobasidium pullulans]|nr:hypothetical protein D6D17_00650 [Aureobasidium pullulans]THZ06820.1 hypothetical protein D6C93_01311 [Aureobasidium pullulans]
MAVATCTESANADDVDFLAPPSFTPVQLSGYHLGLGPLVGASMLIVATTVFLYYTIWTLVMPFVDSSHPSQSLFPPRVWAIRLPVILILVGGAVVGSFLSLIMIKSNRQKALKAQKSKAK